MKISPVSPFIGLFFSLVITSAAFIAYALLLTYTDLSNEQMPAVVLGVIALSLTIGGGVSAIKAGQRGIIYGMVTGLLYIVLAVVAGMLYLPDFSIGTKTFVSLAMALACGGLGGIIGVGIALKKNHQH